MTHEIHRSYSRLVIYELVKLMGAHELKEAYSYRKNVLRSSQALAQAIPQLYTSS